MRYAGFPEFVKVLVDIGFLNDEEKNYLKESIPWNEATQKIISAPSSDENDLAATICAKASFKDEEEKTRILSGLRWLGLFSSEKVSGLALTVAFHATLLRACAYTTPRLSHVETPWIPSALLWSRRCNLARGSEIS